jgi:tellurium resistance protein TerD
LSKTDPTLREVLVGLGWAARSSDGADFDLDASLFMVQENGKVRGDHDFIFYNQLKSSDGSVEHAGDNRTGEGEGDDEAIKVNLSQVPAEITRLSVVATIHDAAARKQNFGMVQNAFIRVVNDSSGREISRYDLAEDCSVETARIFGEVYRHGGEWKFRAVGQGYQGGLAALARNFGVNVG